MHAILYYEHNIPYYEIMIFHDLLPVYIILFSFDAILIQFYFQRKKEQSFHY